MEEHRVGGALKSPDDDTDEIFEHVAQGPANYYWAEYPIEFDLRKYVKPSRDQGNRGICAAFTGAAIKEIQIGKSGQSPPRLSPEFIYHHRENKPRSGMYGRDVFRILQKYGTVPEDAYPCQNDDKPPESPRRDLYEIAAKYRISHFAKVVTVVGLKKALLEIGACYLQLPLYKGRPYFWRPGPNEVYDGGHAVTVIGYTIDGFILQNSWGEKWNGDGCIIFPYNEWSCQLECWVATDEVAKKSRDVETLKVPEVTVVKHEHLHVHRKESSRETKRSSSSSWTLSSTKSSNGTEDITLKPKKKRRDSNCSIM